MSKAIESWLSAIYKINPFKVELGTRRIKAVLEQLPQSFLTAKVITVTGTNGKGSTVAFLSHCLTASGYQTGTFTSPHIKCFNERIQINNQPVSDELLCDAFATIEAYRGDIDITFFEYAFLAAVLIFQQHPLDVVILEVGVGGRDDAVNCIDADLAVITTIDYDHQKWLGQTREAIASNKVGIARAGKPIVCGDPNPPAAIYAAAEQLKAPLYVRDRDFSAQFDENGCWNFDNQTHRWSSLSAPLLPLANAVTACQVLSLLSIEFPLDTAAIAQVMQTTSLPGRMQPLPDNLPGVMDVAHNPQSIAYLAAELNKSHCAGTTHAIFSMLADKDMYAALLPMIDIVDIWHLVALDNPRAATLDELVAVLAQHHVDKICLHADVHAAYQAAASELGAQDRLVAFGSFYLIAALAEA